MGVTTTQTNKPFNPRGNDQSPKGYNRAALYSGKALDFDGVNDSVFLSDFVLTGNTASISFYLNWDDYGTDAVQFICEGDTYNDLMIHVGGASGVDGFRFAMTSGATFDSTGVIQKGYNFYTLTTDGTTANVYVNGVLFNSEQVNLGSVNITELGIGNRQLNNTLFFDGKLSGFKIFNTALTAAQVADLYNNPEKVVPTGLESNLKLWLPMMEGAGTTAYDGSGNGNHGTISGATYVNGIGAPVAQSAVMDWNKGSNLVPDVNDFNSANEVTTTTGLADDPAGRSNAVRFTKTTDTTPRYGFQTCGSATLLANTDYVISLFYKYDGHAFASSIEYNNSGHFDLSWACNLNIAASGVTISSTANCTGKVVEYSNDWYRVDVELTTGASPSGNPQYLVKMQGNTGTSLLVAYAQLEQASSVGPLVPTFGTTQTSEVLLPQGLTTGRDITGVNLFENVRKQGALNLDGNSWAEVHDNESLDITSAISVEAWVYFDGAASRGILGRWYSSISDRSYLLLTEDATNIRFYVYTSATSFIETGDALTTNNWYHVVGTYDGANQKIYINGSESANKGLSGNIQTSSEALEIGRYFDQITGRGLTNQIAQPRIYNRALTASEIQQNYNAGKNTYTN